jgi:hypothetical protein
MLNTIFPNRFQVEINDTTVSVLPGTARIGNSIIAFPGGLTTFANMLSFSGQTNRYQNVLLFLSDATATVGGQIPLTNGAAFLTTAVSAPVVTQRELTIPAMPIDANFPNPSYARGYPLALFSLFSSDGTKATLQSYHSM